MMLLQRALLVLMGLLIVAACTLETTTPAEDAAPATTGEGATPERSPEPTQRASRLIKLPVRHCWIDPVAFDRAEWAVVRQDQFGWGDGYPKGWEGQGLITRLSDSSSRYADRSGHVLRLVLADDPEAAAVFRQLCD